MQKKRKKAFSKRALWKWFDEVTGGRKWQIGALLILQMVLGASSVAYAMYLREMIDAAAAKDSAGFTVSMLKILLLVGFQILCRAVTRFLNEDARSSFENRIKMRLFAVLMRKDYASVTAVHSGEWINRLTSDSVVAADGLVQILPEVAGMLVRMLSALAAILIMEPRFGFLLVPGGILLVFLTWFFRKKMKKLHKSIQEADGRLRVFLQEHLGSLLIVRSFAVEDEMVHMAGEKMSEHKRARMCRNRFSNICNVGFAVLMQAVYLCGAIYCCYGIMLGSVTYGTLIAMLQLISQVQSPVANITGYLPKYYAMIASAERLMEAEQFADGSAGQARTIEEIRSYYEKEFAALCLQDVSFTYLPQMEDVSSWETVTKEGMPQVLHHVNLTIPKGKYIAFTGQSGCGKSTIMKLLMCLYPTEEGERYLLNTDGSHTVLDSSWNRLFAYVPQGNQLMSGTIREVIAFADKDAAADEVRLRRSLVIACADEFVDQLEHGLDTVLGERGMGLSEGQMQRIAIARAVFSDNPILILDEATSALDEVTERKVLENMREMTDKTVLLITHRPAALAICDRQILMKEQGGMINVV